MKHRIEPALRLLLPLLILALACGPGSAPATEAPATAAPSAAPGSPTFTPTTDAGPPEPVLPTPPSGPAIPHLSPGRVVVIQQIRMFDERHGWAVGGADNFSSDHILRTSDGGRTWLDVTPPEPQPAAGEQVTATAYFFDAVTAWVTYGPANNYPPPEPSGLIWFTRDAGLTWEYGQIDSALAVEAYAPAQLQVPFGGFGWMLIHLGAGMHHDYLSLHQTRDGGRTWQTLITPYEGGGIQSCSKAAMLFTDLFTGWLAVDCVGVAPDPYVFVSNDGGATWEKVLLPAPPGQPDLFQSSSGYCGGEQLTADPSGGVVLVLYCKNYVTDPVSMTYYLYRSPDRGVSWDIQSYPGGQLVLFDADNGLALGRLIHSTSDGGRTWREVRRVYWDGQFSFIGPLTGWAVARNEGLVALVRTDDGGSSWVEIEDPLVIP